MNAKQIGFLLLVLGFLASAFLASLDPLTMQWMYFVPAIGVGVVGVVTIKRVTAAHERAPETLSARRAVLDSSLDAIVANLDELSSRVNEIATDEMRHEVDKRLRGDLAAFAEARESMIHIFGMQAYAEIMSSFAYGERYVNRVWSASADGYIDEVKEYVPRALQQFQEARQRLEQAEFALDPATQS